MIWIWALEIYLLALDFCTVLLSFFFLDGKGGKMGMGFVYVFYLGVIPSSLLQASRFVGEVLL